MHVRNTDTLSVLQARALHDSQDPQILYLQNLWENWKKSFSVWPSGFNRKTNLREMSELRKHLHCFFTSSVPAGQVSCPDLTSIVHWSRALLYRRRLRLRPSTVENCLCFLVPLPPTSFDLEKQVREYCHKTVNVFFLFFWHDRKQSRNGKDYIS